MALSTGCQCMSENKVDISCLFKPYKPCMYMILKKNDCLSILYIGLAYVFSGDISGSGS